MPPLNLVGDFGGGALYLVVGVLAALLEAQKSGKGQVVDAAMCDGAASLMSMFFDMTAMGRWSEGRESNFLDGGAHFYGVYECACGNFISIGSIEPQFYALLRQHAGLADAAFDAQMDRKAWPALKQKLAEVFKSKTRDEWCPIMEGTDICFAPVLTMAEAPKHPHMAARKIFVERHGVTQPAPAPRFSRTPSAIREPREADIASLDAVAGGRDRIAVTRPKRIVRNRGKFVIRICDADLAMIGALTPDEIDHGAATPAELRILRQGPAAAFDGGAHLQLRMHVLRRLRETKLDNVCPNCGGGFVPRPIRPAQRMAAGRVGRQTSAVGQARASEI